MTTRNTSKKTTELSIPELRVRAEEALHDWRDAKYMYGEDDDLASELLAETFDLIAQLHAADPSLIPELDLSDHETDDVFYFID